MTKIIVLNLVNILKHINMNNNEKNRRNIIERNFENNEILTLSKLNEKN